MLKYRYYAGVLMFILVTCTRSCLSAVLIFLVFFVLCIRTYLKGTLVSRVMIAIKIFLCCFESRIAIHMHSLLFL